MTNVLSGRRAVAPSLAQFSPDDIYNYIISPRRSTISLSVTHLTVDSYI